MSATTPTSPMGPTSFTIGKQYSIVDYREKFSNPKQKFSEKIILLRKKQLLRKNIVPKKKIVHTNLVILVSK